MHASVDVLFSIFATNLPPVFIIAGAGFLLGRFAAVDVRAASRITFHAFAPALVFNPLITSTVGREDGALLLMILVLGMQLERVTTPSRPGVVVIAVLLSLVATPLAAVGIADLVGLEGQAPQAGVLQASMPSAVLTTILALEFDTLPDFATSAVCVSTLLSPLTVTVLIAYRQG